MNGSKNIISWFVHNPIAANLLLISTIIIGLLSLDELRKEAFPSLAPDRLTISVNFESGSPSQAEEGIAIKVENSLASISGIKRLVSTSDARGSTLTVVKESNYNLDVLLNDVKTKIDAIFNLPENAERPIIEKAQVKEHAIWIQLYGNIDRERLYALTDRLQKDLRRQPAIKDIVLQAEPEPIISVEVNEAKLQAFDKTLNDVADIINAESSAAMTSSLRHKDKTVHLKVAEQAYTVEDFKKIPFVTSDTGTALQLGDIANITKTFEENVFVLSRYNQHTASAIQLVVDERGDIVDIVKQANEVVQNWQNGDKLPPGVFIESWHDQSSLISERLDLLIKNGLNGIAFVFILLALFLNLRIAFWVAAGLPFVLCGTLYLMTDTFFDFTINELTTLGFIMALGIVVDDAVVVGESVHKERAKNGNTIDSTINGVLRVAKPTIFGVLTTVVAFGALSNIDGYGGQIYAQFGTIVVICLLLSLVESKLILPAHLASVTSQRALSPDWWVRLQLTANNTLQMCNERVYKPLLKRLLRWRYIVVIFFVGLLFIASSLLIVGAIKVTFFPAIYGDTASARITMHNDISYGQLQDNLLTVEQAALAADNQLQQAYGGQNSGIGSLQVIASNDRDGTISVELNNKAAYEIPEFADTWETIVGQLEGAKKFQILSTLEFIESFRVEVKSHNEQELKSASRMLLSHLGSTEGLSGIDHNIFLDEPQFKFTLTEQGRSLGIDSSSLAQQVLQTFGGGVVQRFQKENNEIKVRVRYPLSDRQTLSDINNAMVRTNRGDAVPLTSVATVTKVYQPERITRINGERAFFISAVVDKSLTSPERIVKDAQNSIVKAIQDKYPSVVISFAGEAEERTETTQSMSSMFALTMLVIYALLAIPLKSYIQPVIIMSVIPFGVIGAIFGHWMNDLTLSILSLNGIFALSGVVVNDGILLVSKYNELSKVKAYEALDSVVEACSARFRAVILTSFTTFVGLLPLLSETSLQAQFLIPAAASLAYGILFATFITLILIPVILIIKNDLSNLKSRVGKTHIFK